MNPKYINYNPIISIFILFWNSISRINSKSTLQSRWDNKDGVSSNILHKYNEWSFNLHLKNTFALKKSPTFADIQMEKLGNWFTIAKKWEQHLKNKQILRKISASLLKTWVWYSFQFSPQMDHWLQLDYSKQLIG